MAKQVYYETTHQPKTLLLGINAPYNRIKNIQSYYEEFLNLAKTNGAAWKDTLFIKLRDIDPAYFLTKGKLDELKIFCEEHKIETIIISEALTAQQERNLSELLECNVLDRTQLILDIFEKAAHSAEGKTQVAIAMYQYQKSRLAGKGIGLSQQEGALGQRGGPGETMKEKERRYIEQNIAKLKRQLAQIQKNRDTQRKRRLDTRIPHICLIGYTNAGKSTILNALTKSCVLAENKLFATLDTTTRELYLEGQKKGIISDTVGFIQQLPHHLIEAFKSTLSELHYADLLVQVVDVSDQNWESHIKVVHDILQELKIDKQMLYVFNKVDNVQDIDEVHATIGNYQPHVITCAKSKQGLEELAEFLGNWKRDGN